jgi:hypothetical protein
VELVSAKFRRGDRVIYRKLKHSNSPGPRARDVDPAPHGEEYTYCVDKFWVVRERLEHGALVLVTRRGKEHVVSPDDPNLRHAHWWERLFFGSRFPALNNSIA